MRKLLVYIPTYNRYETLMHQLKMLKPFAETGEIQVIVNDNASSQPEYQMVKRFCSEQKNFEYRKNGSNLGANPNILNGFLFCERAQYLLILSDDDLLKPQAIPKIIEILDRYSPDFLYLTHNLNQREEFIQVSQKWLVDNINDGLGLISQVIYKTSFVKYSVRAGFDNLLSCFPHLAIIFESTKNKCFSICRISKEDFFLPEPPQPPSESGIGYKYSLLGFTHLVYNLEDKLRKSFIHSWWKGNWFRVARDMNFAPIQFAICRSLLFKYIKFFSLQWVVFFLLKPLILFAFYLRSRRKRKIS